MGRQRILVYGAGGHAKVVIDILERTEQYEITGIVDDDPARTGNNFCGHPVLGGLDFLLEHGPEERVVLAIGDNSARERLANRLEPLGFQFATAVHPVTSLARDGALGPGTVVMANVAVNPGTVVGRHAILNTGATIDHDCAIGDFAHISPGAHLGGNVTVGPLAHVGIGVSVIPGISIGAGSVIGAGAAVVADIPPGVVAVGVPARVVKEGTKERDP